MGNFLQKLGGGGVGGSLTTKGDLGKRVKREINSGAHMEFCLIQRKKKEGTTEHGAETMLPTERPSDRELIVRKV